MSFFKKILLITITVIFTLPLQAIESDLWPKEISFGEHTIIFYQPQPQSLKDNELKSLAAISVESKNNTEPMFGAIWFSADINVDKENNIAELTNFSLQRLRFSDEKDSRGEELKRLIKEKMPSWSLDISYHKLLSSLEINSMQKGVSSKIKTDAPAIVITQEPTVLVTIDGEPRLQAIKNTKLFKIINTPYTVIMDSNSRYYLNADANAWYSSDKLTSGWHFDNNVSSEIKAQQAKEYTEGEFHLQLGNPPKLIVTTKPTELVSCEGKPEFTPIGSSGIMYVSNTDSDLFMELKTLKYYLLLSGRWYTSKGLDKSWSYVKSSDLPEGFSEIPSDSDSSNVLYSVEGTEESKDAVLDAMIPQTAHVNTKTSSLKVTYDGKPEYKNIDDTSMKYIVNTQTPVILVDDNYYTCDNAIWFKSDSPAGAWNVAKSIPDEIYSIPPSSPLYNVTFVKIYKADDKTDDVYVGYTSGYTNTYVHNNTIVYGTGYYYRPWYGNYYYAYPYTWGFHMRWSPYYGWGFGMSYSAGPYSFGIRRAAYMGAHPPYRYRNGYSRGNVNQNRQGYINERKQSGKRPESRDKLNRERGERGDKLQNRKNLYNSDKNRDRIKNTRDKAQGSERFQSARENSKRSGNVFADRDGNVHRRDGNSWQSRDNGEWKQNRQMDSSRRDNLDRNFQSRERGNNFSRGSFNGGGNRGGFSGGNRGGFSGGGRGGRGGGGRRR